MKRQFMLTRRRLLRASAVTVSSAIGVGIYTWRWEPHWIEIVERPLPVANLPQNLVGARLAHLSDLHIGLQVDDSYLTSVFERIKRLAPDFVVYTGDFTSYHPDVVSHARRMFGQLPLGKRGTFGILGNHDYGVGWANVQNADQISASAKSAGVQLLRNEVADSSGLQVVGLDDLWAGRFEPSLVLGRLDPDGASLVLSHNPDTVDKPALSGYQGWILAGHTHGGQCKPPFLPPPLLPVQNRRYSAGEFTLAGNRRMYISRGVGHLLRVRFNARPEVTLFHLDQAE